MSDVLRLYLVSCGFKNGVIGVSMVPAARSDGAVATAISGLCTSSDDPKPELPLTHLFCKEVTKEELQHLLQVIETGKAEGLPN